MMKVFIMDWGIVFQSKQKTNWFSLSDDKSIRMKINSFDKDHHIVDVVVFGYEFARKYVSKKYWQILDEYRKMFVPITNQLITISDFGSIELLANSLSERQKYNFMFCG